MGPPHASPDPAVLQPGSSACHPDISPFRLLTRHLGLGLWHPANRETAAESFRPDSKALFSNLKGRELNPSHRSFPSHLHQPFHCWCLQRVTGALLGMMLLVTDTGDLSGGIKSSTTQPPSCEFISVCVKAFPFTIWPPSSLAACL